MLSKTLVTNQKEEIKTYLKKNIDKETVLIELYPEKNEYLIDQIRQIQKEIKYFNPKKRIYVLYDFFRSSIEFQNAFLKILEEPPKDVGFILITDSLYYLLPTIISRTKVINLKKDQLNIVDERLKKIIAAMKDGQLKLIAIKDKQQAKEVILSLISFYRKGLAKNLKSGLILKQLIKNLSFLENNNLNPQLTIDNLLIFIYKNSYNQFKNA